MADLFLQPFAGDAGDEPDNAEKLLGGVYRTLQDGAGAAYREGSTSTVLYRYLEYPGRADFGAQLKGKFTNPAGSGPILELLLDVQDEDNYLFLAFTPGTIGAPWAGLGEPELAFGKVVGGVRTFLSGPHSVNGGAPLTEDQLYTAEIVRSLDAATGLVTYELRWDESWLDAPRPAALATYQSDQLSHANLRLGWQIHENENGKLDDLRAFELVTEASDEEDRLLQVGGESFTGAEMRSRSKPLSPAAVDINYLDGGSFTFWERCRWHERSFRNEQGVVWRDQGKVLFRGVIEQVEYGGTPGAESVTYRCKGRKGRARSVTPQDPRTLSSRIVWNGEPEDYVDGSHRALFSSKSYAAILEWYFSQNSAQLQQQKAVRPGAALPYEESDLTPLAGLSPLRTELSGDFLAHITGLLAQLRSYAFHHQPSTDLWRVLKVSELTPVTLETAADKLAASSLREDSSQVFTKVCISSVSKEKKSRTRLLSLGEIEPDWDTDLEDEWTPDKARRRSCNATITAVNLGAGPEGQDEIDIEYANPPRPYTGEWAEGQVRVASGAATGEVFGVLVQTAGATPPYAGTVRIDGNFVGLPVPTDEIVLEAIPSSGQSNGFTNVYRRFHLPDLEEGGIVPEQQGGCAKLRALFAAVGDGSHDTDTDTEAREGEAHGMFLLDGGAAGMVGFGPIVMPLPKADKPQNIPGGYELPNDLELEYDYWEVTVQRACKPAEGWSGTGYSDDEGKWAGAGVASGNDLGIERVLAIEEPEWKDATQTSAVNARAQEILDAVSQRQFTGKPTFLGLLYDFSDLGVALQLEAPGRTLPTADAYILPVAVTYTYGTTGDGSRTQLDLGGTAQFAANGQRFAAELRANSLAQRLQEVDRKLREVQACWGNTGAGDAPRGAAELSNPVCDKRVLSSFSGVSPPERAPGAEPPKWLDEIIEWLLTNKEQLDSQMEGVLGNLKKTTDDLTGEVLEAGELAGPSGGTSHQPGGGTVHVDPGEEAPPNRLDEIEDALEELQELTESNKKTVEGLTVNPDGSVTDPDGDTYTPNGSGGWTPVGPADPDGPTMGGQLGAIHANKKKLEQMLAGHTPSAPKPGITPTITSPSGAIYGFTPTGYTKLSGSGLAGPQIGGAVGGLASKCGSTFDGAADFGSGPGTLLVPGDAVGPDGAYYHPPTDDPADVVELEEDEIVPAHTGDQQRAAASEQSLIPYRMDDRGGPVFYDEAHKSSGPNGYLRYWRVEPGTARFVEVEEVTAGTGENQGDFTQVTPTRYHEGPGRGGTMKRAVHVATAAALDSCTHSEPTLTATANGTLTIDGRSMSLGERVLVKNQAGRQENGIYTVQTPGSAGTPWVLRRSLDTAREDSTLSGALVFVREGATNTDKLFKLDTLGEIEPGMDTQEWSEWAPGGGSGDMTTAIYDHDTDGIVDEADYAAEAGLAAAVDTDGVDTAAIQDGAVTLDKLDSEAASVLVALQFGRTNPSGNQTAALAGFNATAGRYVVLPAGATLVGISAEFSGSFTVGTIKFRCRKNGAGSTTLELGPISSGAGSYATGTGVTFSAGDTIGCEYDTSVSYNGLSGSWAVVLWVKMARI
ncbi:MAG: hypothetical protein IPK67_18675 [Planctomycetes bacterium]|nr:hypothetical protein [Planctomycetota bacterium]